MTLTTAMTLIQIAPIVAAIGAGIVLIAYLALIAYPAWSAYGRNWEKVSALLLSVYVLFSMLAVGAVLGLVIFKALGTRI